MARVTGLEPATSGVTGRHSNQLSYTRAELRGSVKWMPLLSRRVEVQELSFVDADVQLEKLADGRTNWDFGASDTGEAAPSGDDGGVSASIGKASLKNASLNYADRAAGTEYALKDLNLDASMQGFDKPLKAKADGIFQDQAFDIDLTIDTPEQLQSGTRATIDAKFDSKTRKRHVRRIRHAGRCPGARWRLQPERAEPG
jgi:AsmA protein